MKKCTRCLETKSLDDFVLDRRNKSGRGSRCTLCDRAIKTAPRKAELARKAADLEAAISSYRPVSNIIAADIVRDRSIRDDCVQEAMIRVWEILTKQPTAARPYVNQAIKRRIMEISMRQTFTGHTGRRGKAIDPLRRPHGSLEALAEDGWEPSA